MNLPDGQSADAFICVYHCRVTGKGKIHGREVGYDFHDMRIFVGGIRVGDISISHEFWPSFRSQLEQIGAEFIEVSKEHEARFPGYKSPKDNPEISGHG